MSTSVTRFSVANCMSRSPEKSEKHINFDLWMQFIFCLFLKRHGGYLSCAVRGARAVRQKDPLDAIFSVLSYYLLLLVTSFCHVFCPFILLTLGHIFGSFVFFSCPSQVLSMTLLFLRIMVVDGIFILQRLSIVDIFGALHIRFC